MKGREITYVDSHIHLADEAYQGKVGRILGEGEKEGVKIVIASSEDMETSLKTLEIAQNYPLKVLPALGIHPWAASETEVGEVGKVVSLIDKYRDRLAAVGEVGLDLSYTRGSSEAWERQREIFRSMLEVAEGAELPVVAHSRRSALEVFEEASSYRVKMVFHWFSGEIKVLRRILDAGYHVTVGPSIYYSKHIQRIVRETPLSRLMAETDGPVRYRGPFQDVETTPALIPRVVEKIAEIKKESLEDAVNQILDNCRKVFAGMDRALKIG